MANGEIKDMGGFQNPNPNDKLLQENIMSMTPQTQQISHQNQHQEKDSKVALLTKVKSATLVQPPIPILQPHTDPPPRCLVPSRESVPKPRGNGGAPPPPPPVCGSVRTLGHKKTDTKLKRSTKLGNLYRTLKGRVEGTVQYGKLSSGPKGSLGNSSNAGGKQGMANALAEITKRSPHFQKIEEDVRKYMKHIMRIEQAIISFQTKDMDEILKFHRDVEAVLDQLTDESQVLSRFKDFPQKKLETLRIVVALHKKLDKILKDLQNWKFEAPTSQLLDNVESYFNKIRVEVDTIERTKDEELEKYHSHNIDFDFIVLVRIKESMVDISSRCMEMAIKDKREGNQAEDKIKKRFKKKTNKKGSVEILWRAFQLAFRVYTFAGGHDDRAENLTKELAQEIESHSSS